MNDSPALPRFALAGLFALALTAHAQTPQYTFTDLGTLWTAGTDESTPAGINQMGQVAVVSRVQPGEVLSFVWRGGSRVVLPSLGGNYFLMAAVAHGIDDQGVAYGESTAPTNNYVWHAVAWPGSVIQDIATPALEAMPFLSPVPPDPMQEDYLYSALLAQRDSGVQVLQHTRVNKNSNWRTDCTVVRVNGVANGALATPVLSGTQTNNPACSGVTIGGISAVGTIAGSANLGGTTGYVATLWDLSGQVIAKFQGVTELTGINALGHAVGNGNGGPVFWDGGNLRPMSTGGGGALAKGINGADRIVGSVSGHAAVWAGPDALPVDLNTRLVPGALAPGWTLTAATGINDSGWIIGTAVSSTATRTFLLQPTSAGTQESGDVPLPGWALLSLALILCGSLLRQGRAMR